MLMVDVDASRCEEKALKGALNALLEDGKKLNADAEAVNGDGKAVKGDEEA